MGIAPAGTRITMHSQKPLAHRERADSQELGVVDLLDTYRQLGVDVFARRREFNKTQVPEPASSPFRTAENKKS